MRLGLELLTEEVHKKQVVEFFSGVAPSLAEAFKKREFFEKAIS